MRTLTWDQITAWRLAQHHLLDRADYAQRLDVVSQIGGLHAQMMSAAELSLWARVYDLRKGDVETALWGERTLVKSWFMRGTLHLIPTHDYPVYIGALSTLRHFRRASWQRYFNVTSDELDAIIAALGEVLSDQPVAREQLAEAVAAQTDLPKLRELLLSGWGMILKPASFQGALCFGESVGQNVTFVEPHAWLGEGTPAESQTALGEVAWRYLNAYGPSTPEDFARWSGLEDSAAKKVFRAFGDQLESVEVDGWQAWMPAVLLPLIEALPPPRGVSLLPHFDAYTIGLPRQSQTLLTADQKARIYRQQGWISPVVLVNGEMAGVWGYDLKRDRLTVTIELFAPPGDETRQSLEVEAQGLGAFLGAASTQVDYLSGSSSD